MKIVLDTKEETLQDLQDTVRMLQALIESRGGVVNQQGMFSSSTPTSEAALPGLMSMFGDTSAASTLPQQNANPLAQLDEGSNDPDRDIKIIEY